MAPPTMVTAPTSAMTRPKPAIIAAMRPGRASRIFTRTACMRVAPRLRAARPSLGSTTCNDAWVKPVTIGAARITCTSTIAAGVYTMPRLPSGPLRMMMRKVNTPTTTGGSAMKVCTTVSTAPLPRKSNSESRTPSGMPISALMTVASPDTTSDSHRACQNCPIVIIVHHPRPPAPRAGKTVTDLLAAAHPARLSFGVGMEQHDSLYLVGSDHLLPLLAGEELDEVAGSRGVELDARVRGRVYHFDAVEVVQRRVALHQYDELYRAFPGHVGRAIAQGVGVLLVCYRERLAHALAGNDVPGLP